MTANVEEGWSLSNDWMFDDDIDKRDSELLVEEATTFEAMLPLNPTK